MIARLRAHTTQLHDEVEALLYGREIMARTITRDQLVHQLMVHHRFHQLLEQWMAPHAHALHAMALHPVLRSGLLADDLRSFGVDVPAAPPTSPAITLPQLLGVLYVSEGSMLGAAVIARALKAHAQLHNARIGFYTAYGDALRAHWLTLCEKLNEMPDMHAAGILEGAEMGFRHYKEFSRAIPLPGKCVQTSP